jgi:hypothetical protein
MQINSNMFFFLLFKPSIGVDKIIENTYNGSIYRITFRILSEIDLYTLHGIQEYTRIRMDLLTVFTQ